MHYELIDGLYVLRDGDRKHPPLIQVAVGYMNHKNNEELPWILKKHGDPEDVQDWADQARDALSRLGHLGKSMASDIHVISGNLDIQDLNETLRDPKYVLWLVKNAVLTNSKNGAQSVKIDGSEIFQGK